MDRYERQTRLPEIGLEGQKKLLSSKIIIVGLGGLGAPIALYLAGAGVGTLGLIDDDVVELSNLQRQVVHFNDDLGRNKVDSAAEKLRAYNPEIAVKAFKQRLTRENAADFIEQYDFIIDASDNFDSKFLIADACHAAKTAYSHAGLLGFRGQTITVIPGESACYRCIFENPPVENEKDVPQGPLGVLPGVIGCIQATEAIKYVVGCGELLTNRLLTYDALSMSFRTVKINRAEGCVLCAEK